MLFYLWLEPCEFCDSCDSKNRPKKWVFCEIFVEKGTKLRKKLYLCTQRDK